MKNWGGVGEEDGVLEGWDYGKTDLSKKMLFSVAECVNITS